MRIAGLGAASTARSAGRGASLVHRIAEQSASSVQRLTGQYLPVESRYGARLPRLNPLLVDALLALLVTIVALDSLVGRLALVVQTEDGGSIRFRTPDLIGVTLLVIGAAVLVWRRRAPLTVLAVTSVSFFVYHDFGYAPPPIPYAPLIALNAVALAWAFLPSLGVCLVLIGGVIALALTRQSPITDDQFLSYVLSVLAAWGLGYGMQLARVRTELIEERAVRLSREQETSTRLAVEQERARIARELHDIVAHHVSLIVAQATSVGRILPRQPEQGPATLRSIETIGREALVEMRRMLDVLQPEPGPDGQERGPMPVLASLPALLAHVHRAGVPVTLTVQGRVRHLPVAVEVNGYRIVQEALTNAVKHAGPARVQVLVDYAEDQLRLRISDDGKGGGDAARFSAGGRGLVGMHQRVALLGGRLAVGPGTGGGFEVAAEIPLGDEPG